MPVPLGSADHRRRRVFATLTLVSVCAFAVTVRLWSAWHARLSGEEAAFWDIAVGIARGQEFPLLGHPVSGSRALHPGPLFFWIIALSQVFVTSPLVANFFVSLFGLFGALMLARTSASRAQGTIFFLLILAAPWWVVYTNSTWPGYLFPGVCACFVAALLRIVAQERSRAVGPLVFLLVAGFQIHLSLLHYWPLALVTVAVYRPRLNWRWLLGGLVIGAACYIPYLVSELHTGFANTRLLLVKSQGGARQARVLYGLYLYFLGFPTTDISYLWKLGFWSPFDHFQFWGRGDGVRQTSAFFRTAGPPALLWFVHGLTWMVSVAALAVGAARLIAGWRRGARRPPPLVLIYLVGLADVGLFYGLSGKGGYAHYVSVILPLAFVPVVALLAWLARFRFGRAVVGVYLALFLVAGCCVMRGYYRVDSQWSAVQSAQVVRFVLEHTRAPDGAQEPFQVRFGLSRSWPNAYQVLAWRLHHARWLTRENSAHRFFVGLLAPGARAGEPPRAPGLAAIDPDRLDLETIFVSGR